MKTHQKLNLLIYFIISIYLLTACVVDYPDYSKPEIRLTAPDNNTVIGDSVFISAEASDDGKVEYVDFFINDQKDSASNDYEYPYSHVWNVIDDSLQINRDLGNTRTNFGKRHKIYAKVHDNDKLEMISEIIYVYYKWFLLVDDGDEGNKEENTQAIDIDKFFIRNHNDSLEFRIETNGKWRVYDDSTGLNIGIFLDTDQNADTGYKTDSTNIKVGNRLVNTDTVRYSVNDIGADYVLVIGHEGNGLYIWNSAQRIWQFDSGVEVYRLEDKSSFAELRIHLNQINNAAAIDIVAAYMLFEFGNIYWDVAPNSGHISYGMDKIYLSEIN